MHEIQNPVLRGFYPDPSLLRVGDDYYLATSTFEWFPGVTLHHSRDLVHWRALPSPLCRTSQLSLCGSPSSGGVWAPCLSYADGLFYLIYTNVTSFSGIFKDTHNYLVTAREIDGEWSDPVALNSSGFDPSLFHDADGRKWLVNMVWDHRSGHNRFGGIVLQEYSPAQQRLVGPVHTIFNGTQLGLTEGPHLYRHNGFYYLITAEGGTSWEHAVTVARSKALTGPYKADPEGPVLTSRQDKTPALQKAGHASLVETQSGEWYVAHLCARPLPTRGCCPLGRETALQKVMWTADGWLRLACGGNAPQTSVPAPALPPCPWPPLPAREDFDAPALSPPFQTLRLPLGEDMLSLTQRPGWLRLFGAESLSSLHRQSLVARRQQAFCCTACTRMQFSPVHFQQMAGLICWYDTLNFHYLYVTCNEAHDVCIDVLTCDNGTFLHPLSQPFIRRGSPDFLLRAEIQYDTLSFSFAEGDFDAANSNLMETDGDPAAGFDTRANGISEAFSPIGPALDASILSDEHFHSIGAERFTGAFLGMCCQDLTGAGLHADFDWFSYREYSETI